MRSLITRIWQGGTDTRPGSASSRAGADAPVDAPVRAAAPVPPSPRQARSGEPQHKGNIWFLALTALGVVFGDIGTSPLYTFSVTLSATSHAVPTAADVLGIVSLIFWALMA